MSQGMRPVPAARLVLAALTLFLAGASLPRPGFAGPPPLPDYCLGMRIVPLLLLSRPDVRADVGLDEAQAADAERVMTELYLRAIALRGKKNDPEVLAARAAIDEAEERWLKSRLTDAQRKRLIEIDLQWEGPSALISRPIVADHVGLTPEQRASLTQAVADYHRRLPPAVRIRSQMGDLLEGVNQLAQQARAQLTPEQRERWFAMLGRRFTPQLGAAVTMAPR
jgi:hypothetical protein